MLKTDIIKTEKLENGNTVVLFDGFDGMYVVVYSINGKALYMKQAGINEQLAFSVFNVVIDLYRE